MRAIARTAILETLVCILLIFSCAGNVAAAETTTSGQVIVTGYSLDPKVLPGDEGVLTVTLKNAGSTPVNVGMPALFGGQLQYLNSKQISGRTSRCRWGNRRQPADQTNRSHRGRHGIPLLLR